MPKFVICPSCEGSGGSSAYLGSFTSEELWDQGDEFVEDYIAGNFDRKCDECNGQRVVKGCKADGCDQTVAVVHSYWSGRHEYDGCFEHNSEAREDAEDAAVSAAERAFGC